MKTSILRMLTEMLLVAISYIVAAKFCIYLAPSATFQSVFWPASGIALTAVLLRGPLFLLPIILAGGLIHGSQAELFRSLSGCLLAVALILIPALQAWLGWFFVKAICGSDLWVFTSGTKLVRWVISGALLPSLICALMLSGALALLLQGDLDSYLDAFLSIWTANFSGIAIVATCLLLIVIKNPLVLPHRKVRIVVPIIGLFAVAALCYGALYSQLRHQFEMAREVELKEQAVMLEGRINLVNQQIQNLRFWLLNHEGDKSEFFHQAAERALAAHLAISNEPPYYALALLGVMHDDVGDIDNYRIEHIYPHAAFERLHHLPLASDDNARFFMRSAVQRTQIHTLPNLDLARTSAGSFVMILLHQLVPNDAQYLLSGIVDVTNLAYGIGADYSLAQRELVISDVLSGRVLYRSKGNTVDTGRKVEFKQTVSFGDRIWLISAVYDSLWVERHLQRKVLYISIYSLLLISIFTLLILSALVSAQSLERAVVMHSKDLDNERRFLDAVFESLPVFIFVKDVATRKYVRANRYVERMLGVQRSWYEGKSAYDIFSEAEAAQHTATDIQALEQNGVIDVGEQVFQGVNGKRWVHTRKTVIRDSTGVPLYILGVAEDITEKRSQGRTLDSLVEALPTSLLVLTDDGTITYANADAQHTLKVIVGTTTIDQLLADCDFSIVTNFLGDAESYECKPVVVSATTRNLEGGVVPVEATFTRTLWAGERCYLALLADVSARVNAQRQLRESENQLRMLMANLEEGVCSVDLEGNITYANSAACTILQYEDSSILGLNFYQRIFGVENSEIDPIFKAHSAGQVSRVERASFTCAKGQRVIVDYTCTPLRAKRGETLGAVVAFTNVSEKLEYQKNLSIQNELISLGLDAAGLGSWEWMMASGVITWSHNLYDIAGISPSHDVLTLSIVRDLIHPHDIEQVRIVDELARETKFVTDICCRLIRPGGEVIWVTGKYRYFEDEHGEVVRARGVLWDSTEETLMQQDNLRTADALRRSNKELDDFAHIASHDLKEPLRGISNYSSFLLEDYFEQLDASGQHMLQSLVRLTGHMEGLINDLLNYSKLNRTELAYGEVNIAELLADIVASLEPRLEALNAHVEIRADMPSIYGDRVRIKEVFRNLIVNAMKYNDKLNKAVVVGAESRMTETIFWVKDDGIGIESDFQSKIFDVFRRLHGNSEYGGGSGIGLSIVKKVVDQHSGRLWVESVPGVGSTFFFTVPFACSLDGKDVEP